MAKIRRALGLEDANRGRRVLYIIIFRELDTDLSNKQDGRSSTCTGTSDAESFLWVLTWVCLRHQESQLLRKSRPFDEWLKVDINTCRERKSDFIMSGRYEAQPLSSHQSN
jgi:hypothetical protein